MNGKNKIRVINIYVLFVIRYLVGIISWLKEEIEVIDIKIRKFFIMYGGFYFKFSILRLYVKRKEGGRGLVSVSIIV